MVRWSVVAGCAAVVAGAAFVTGATVPAGPAKGPTDAKSEPAKTVVVVGQKTGFFNMAKVMREYKKAQVGVERLNARRVRAAANLLAMRAMYLELQLAVQRTPVAAEKERIGGELITVARRVEDTDRELSKMLNDRAATIIVGLHDDIRATTAAVARENGLTALLAYPDAVTAQDAENPMVKELRLKPPALQPFYLDPSVEFTDEILRRLNDKFAAESDD